MLRKTVTAGAAISMAAGGLLLSSPISSAAPTAAAGKTTPTHYAMQASGYSTRVKGGSVPLNSDQTAFRVIGCTNKAGLNKTNTQVSVSPLNLLTVNGAKTRVRTTQRNGVTSSWAKNTIASVTVGDPAAAGAAKITAITSLSRAYHTAKGFKASTKTSVADIKVGALSLGVPTRGHPVVIPGIATVSLGASVKHTNKTGATAENTALRIKLDATGTVVFLAHSRATIAGGVKSALFHGSSYAAKAQALAGTVNVGRTPFMVMPCQGTNGHRKSRDVARVNPTGSGLVIKGLHTDESADQTMTKASGYERGRVARVRLGEGGSKSLVVRGIVGKANVHYVKGQGIKTSTKGSHILGVRLLNSTTGNARVLHFGRDNVINIAGLAKLQAHVVKKTKSSIQITELRISVLGTGPDAAAQIDLGYAKIGVTKSGL